MKIFKNITKIFNNNNFMGSCECGKYEKCIRKIHSNSRGKLWVKNKEHFKCGVIKKQIDEMLKLWEIPK